MDDGFNELVKLPTPDQAHLLHSFMHRAVKEMEDDYCLIRKNSSRDPGTAGDQGEETWAALLRNWLPCTYHVCTKGVLLSHENVEHGPQMDVIVLHPCYPRKLLHHKYYLAGGVVAAFSCKTTLRAEGISDAMKRASAIQKLCARRSGTPYDELYGPVIVGLLAHSHVWDASKAKPTENIEKQLMKANLACVEHPREMLDCVCVSNLGFWHAHKCAWDGPGYFPWDERMAADVGRDGAVTTSYQAVHDQTSLRFGAKSTPIGMLLSFLWSRLAFADPSIREMASYFDSVLTGSSSGKFRTWPATVYSEGVKSGVLMGQLKEHASPWDKWARYL